ncbi:hypothetical protein BSK59_24870 [Paenibacillus odorifer]|uniref:hypothetical protein n=1 Tax=Paenibacillus odorifer TaxID=189426 RepID=UPI0009701D8A|nr:hypothetical protein [Paenibacillus odorifer]OME49015.1 hypothetical protein BSK59_24870 [Paenibacillus odorifer]
MKKILFAGDYYDYEEYEDGSKKLQTEKNSRGFKITINVSGDPEEHKAGIAAVKDFFVKGNL